MRLAEVQQRCVDELRDNIAMLFAEGMVSDKAANLLRLSELFQGLGICHLLLQADVGQFRENLMRSAFARRYLLRNCQIEEVDSTCCAISRSESVFDALVAGDLGTAKEIIQLSKITHDPRTEYEEDYLFHHFMNEQILASGQTRELESLLKRWDEVVSPEFDPRLEVCKSIVAGDPVEFESNLEDLLASESASLDEKRPSITPPYFLFWPKSYVSIQGLAFLRVAELSGMQISGEFQRCPEIAGPYHQPISELHDFFEDIQEELADEK